MQQDDRQSWFSKKKIPEETGVICRIGPQRALFGGVRDLVLVPSKGKPASGETPGYLKDRLRAHKGHGTSQLVAQNILHFGKNAKTARILPHSMIMPMLSVGIMRNLVVHADSL